MNKLQWILVANASEASLYSLTTPESTKKKPELSIIEQRLHAQSRQKDSRIAQDKCGHFRGRLTGHGDFIESSFPKKHEAQVFARELVELLEKGRTSNRYDKLTLVASPHFFGIIKGLLGKPLQQCLNGQVTKDYTKEHPDRLLKLLAAV